LKAKAIATAREEASAPLTRRGIVSAGDITKCPPAQTVPRLAVRRRAARVQWVDNVITEIIKQHIDSDGDPNIPPDEVKPWLMESRKEEQLMVRSAKLAIDAGVAEAVVRRLEMEGKVITDALVAGLDSLELTPEQRMTALSVMHNQLTGGFNGNNDDGNVIDQ